MSESIKGEGQILMNQSINLYSKITWIIEYFESVSDVILVIGITLL